MIVNDMTHLESRNGFVELCNILFMCRSMRQIVQVRSARQDKSMEAQSKIRGTELKLRSIQFDGVENIGERLKYLAEQGFIPSAIANNRCDVGKIWIVD